MSSCILGSIILFTIGIAWLSAFIGLSGAITHGLLPFIIPGLVKVFILSGALKAIGFRG